MRRTGLFLSRFAIALWAALTIAFLLLLTSNAPRVPQYTPFASLSIRTESSIVYLPNRIFRCTRKNQQFECETDIQNRLLKVNLTSSQQSELNSYYFNSCNAFYDGKSIDCENVGSTYAPIIAQIYEVKNLGLSPTGLRSIQQQYWGINLLMQLGEIRIFWIGTGLSIAAGLIAASFAWQWPNNLTKTFVCLVCGVGTYQIAWRFLGHIPFNTLAAYGIVPDTSIRLIHLISIAIGILTAIATLFLLRRRSNRVITVLLSFVSSLGVFSVCWQVLAWNVREILGFISFSFGIDTSTISPAILLTLTTLVAIVPAITAAIWLWSRTDRSTKAFMTLSSGFGAVAIATHFFLLLLLGLGYAD